MVTTSVYLVIALPFYSKERVKWHGGKGNTAKIFLYIILVDDALILGKENGFHLRTHMRYVW